MSKLCVPNILDNPLSQTQTHNKESYVLNGSKGFCYVCNLELTSVQHCNQHISGNKHLKKEKELASRNAHSLDENNAHVQSMSQATERQSGQDYVLNYSGGKCFVCDVLFTSHTHGNQHLAGQKHKKKLLTPFPQVSPLSSHFPSSLAAQLVPVIPSAIASPGSKPAGPNGEAYIMNGTKGYCYVCSLELTSVEHANSHLNGTKHRKKCGAENVSSMATSLTNGKVLMCKICKVPFSCIKNAEEHFLSDKHKKKVAVAEAEKDYSNDPEQTVVMKPYPRHESSCSNKEDKSPNVIRQTLSATTREVTSHHTACTDGMYFLDRNLSGPIVNPVEFFEILDAINTNKTPPSSEVRDVLHGATLDKSQKIQASNFSREMNANLPVDLSNACGMEGKSLNKEDLPSSRSELKKSLSLNLCVPITHEIQSSNDQTTHINTQSTSNTSNKSELLDGLPDKKNNVDNLNEPCQEVDKLKSKTVEGHSELFSFEPDAQLCSSMIDNTKQKGYYVHHSLGSVNDDFQSAQLTITQTSLSQVMQDPKQNSSNTLSDFQVLSGSNIARADNTTVCGSDQSCFNTSVQAALLAVRTESSQQKGDLPVLPNTPGTEENQNHQSTASGLSAPSSSSIVSTQRQNLYFMPTQLQEDMTTQQNADQPGSSSKQINYFKINTNEDQEKTYRSGDKQNCDNESNDQELMYEVRNFGSINEQVASKDVFNETEASSQINQAPTLKTENTSSNLLDLEEAVSNLQINEVRPQEFYMGERKSMGPESEDKYYYFDGSRGFCHACSIELTSFQHANQHLNGQKHQKKLQQLHFTQYLDKETRLPSTAPVVTEISTAPLFPQENYFIFDGCKGLCHACSIELTSTQHARQHISGRPHRRNVERLKLIQQGIKYPNYCEVCKKGFTGTESAVQHFTSSRHKTKVGLLEMNPARICDCLINSKEQLSTHRETWKLKELEAGFNRCLPPQQSVPEIRGNIGNNPELAARSVKVNETQECILADNSQHLTYGEVPKINLERASPPNTNFTNLSPRNVNVNQEGLHNITQKTGRPILGANAALNYSSQMATMATSVLTNHMPLISSVGFALNLAGALGNRIQSSQPGLVSTHPVPVLANPMPPSSSVSSAPTFVGALGSKIPNSQPNLTSHPGHLATSVLPNEDSPNVSFTQNSVGVVGNKSHGSNCITSTGSAENRSNNVVKQMSPVQTYGGASGTFLRNNSDDSDEDGISVSRRGGSDFSRNPGKVKYSKSRGGEKGMISFDRLESEQDENEEEFERLEERQNFNIQEELVKLETPETPMAKPERSTKHGFRYYCKTCDKHMNTRANYNAHIAGNSHLYLSSLQTSPIRQLKQIRKSNFPSISNYEDLLLRIWDCTKDSPRTYQAELVQKTISGNYIVYLPTGTGKTLVAVLTIALMLEENPSRPVLFLVDKVLLVLQQAKYIKEQFHDKKFNRLDDDQHLVKREIFIKAICGGLTSKSERPIWKYDIVVTTAAFCENMLHRGLIRWEDFSMIVLDEVHHCNKHHPYLKLLDTHHNKLSPESRPKILGLTASPAGKSTVQETYQLLQGLLKNLGGAKIAVVEKEKDCLEAYQSSAEVHPICVPLSSKERELRRHLLEYIVLCYAKFASVSSLKNVTKSPCSYLSEALKYPQDRQVSTLIAERFLQDDEPLADLIGEINAASCIIPEKQFHFDMLKMHLMRLLLSLSEVGTGADFVTELDSILKPSDEVKEFETLGLPCKELHARILKFAADGNKDLTMFNKLTETLHDKSYINWDDQTCKALILVRERKLARQLTHKLRDTAYVQEKKLRVTHLVGHGAGAQDYGMDVKKQKRVLDNQEKQAAKKHKLLYVVMKAMYKDRSENLAHDASELINLRYNIVVATSILEEGIDFQSLQLVISMNPPTSLRALVQIRGRARRKGSHFVILCSSEEEVEKLNRLKLQEKNMQAAAQQCIAEDTNT